MPGYRFNPAFRRGWWDGREHLLKKVRGRPGFNAPIGLLPDLLQLAEEYGLKPVVTDQRRAPTRTIETHWNAERFTLRDYQELSVLEAVKDRGLATGKGLLRLPTRSGKTVIAAKIIDTLKVPTIFMVQSEMIMTQTIDLLGDALGIEIGQIGSGVWNPRAVTVASVQTLSKRISDPDTLLLFKNKDLAIFDECHHLEGAKWRAALEECDAFYKIGLSATIFLSHTDETSKGTIWLRATTGPILFEMEPSELIRRGYLLQPRVKLIPVREPEVVAGSYQEAYDLGVIHHKVRNARIATEAREAAAQGLAVLVISRRLQHVAILAHELEQAGLRVGTLTGETDPKERRALVASYKARELDVLLGTVFGEGVDIPTIECVINAEGGKSDKATMQRFRNLTPAPGKTQAALIDFADLTHPLLARHAKARMAMYRSNEEFKLEVCP